MPVYLNKYNRKDFIKTFSIGITGILLGKGRIRNERLSNYFVLISDTHIHWDENYSHPLYSDNGNKMADNLRMVVQNILTSAEYPEGVIINGDVAVRAGHPADYRTFRRLIRPLVEENISVYVTLGNHDDREAFYDTLSEFSSDEFSLIQRHTMVIDSPESYLVLLDSLDVVNETPGLLGTEQLQWLDSALSALTDKPVSIIAHHYPENGNGRGMLDYDNMENIVSNYKNVKAFIYGHSHAWNLRTSRNYYHVNIPSTAYTFNDQQPLGYVHLRFDSDGMDVELECLDESHPWHSERGKLYYSNPNFENDTGKIDYIFIESIFPNPFNSTATIKFKMMDMDHLQIDIYSITGQHIKSIMNNQHLLPGEYSVPIQGDDMASGTYIIQLSTNKQRKIQKFTLIK
jgi:3',5'-cyclic-AMP phosphodiesterase